jgi:DNA-directed RNA polymerase I, II, and III subunit RPABC2/DNA-directed RNA polymerase subunit K
MATPDNVSFDEKSQTDIKQKKILDMSDLEVTDLEVADLDVADLDVTDIKDSPDYNIPSASPISMSSDDNINLEQSIFNPNIDVAGGKIGGDIDTEDDDTKDDDTEDDDTDYDTKNDDTDNDEEYIQKFSQDIRNQYIKKFHGEINHSNYDEINALTKVVRNTNGNVIDPIHQTLPFLTKYEKTKIIGIRAKQINNGADTFIKVPDNIIDGQIIAEMELAAKVLPFIISRPFPNGKKEYWKLSDLEIIDY